MERKQEISTWFKDLQSRIILALEIEDGKGRFGTDNWERPGGGGGITRLMTNGNVIEKGGVNFSAVYGKTPKAIGENFGIGAEEFFATGVSIVIHPLNPFVPIIHMNVRYFENSDGECWFGGGIDLTPAYVFEADAKLFHLSLKDTCDGFDAQYYHRFRENADDYFFLKHRHETRGIGGMFYDRQKPNAEHSFEKLWAFTQAVGETFAPVYIQIMKLRKDTPFAKAHKDWQLHRRSRYVEFNLVYDLGTKFGLESDGRTESILMSMPPLARWESFYQPAEGSPEAESQAFFRQGISWV